MLINLAAAAIIWYVVASSPVLQRMLIGWFKVIVVCIVALTALIVLINGLDFVFRHIAQTLPLVLIGVLFYFGSYTNAGRRFFGYIGAVVGNTIFVAGTITFLLCICAAVDLALRTYGVGAGIAYAICVILLAAMVGAICWRYHRISRPRLLEPAQLPLLLVSPEGRNTHRIDPTDRWPNRRMS
jgi:hypothetical protein